MGKDKTPDELRQYLMQAKIPESSKGKVIPYKIIINTIMDTLQRNKLGIVREFYKTNTNAKIAYGWYQLSSNEDSGIALCLVWQNSYNQQLRFKCSLGIYSKHSGHIFLPKFEEPFIRNPSKESEEFVQQTVNAWLDVAKTLFEETKLNIEKMKNIARTTEDFATLLGNLFLNEKMISSEQLGEASKAFWENEFENNQMSVWQMYTYLMAGLARCHPLKWFNQQKAVYEYILKRFIELESTPEKTEEKSTLEPTQPVEEEKVQSKSAVSESTQKTHQMIEGIIAGDDKKEQAESSDSDQEIVFRSLGKLKELVSEVKKGVTLEHNGVSYRIGDPTIQHQLQGFWLHRIDQVQPEEEKPRKTLEEVSSSEELKDSDQRVNEFLEKRATIAKEEIEQQEEKEEESQVEPVKSKEEPKGILPPNQNEKQRLDTPIAYIPAKDIKINPPKDVEESSKEVDPIVKIIGEIVEEHYGGSREFTYQEVGEQYNVRQPSGETMTLSKRHIQKRKATFS